MVLRVRDWGYLYLLTGLYKKIHLEKKIFPSSTSELSKHSLQTLWKQSADTALTFGAFSSVMWWLLLADFV